MGSSGERHPRGRHPRCQHHRGGSHHDRLQARRVLVNVARTAVVPGPDPAGRGGQTRPVLHRFGFEPAPCETVAFESPERSTPAPA
jgi:hypothetical protein